MVVGQDSPISGGQKTCAEGVDLKTGPRAAAYIELCHPFFVNLWLTICVDRDLERSSRLFVHEFHNDVQQAHAGSIFVNNGLRDLVFPFQVCETILCVKKLLLQSISIRAICGGRRPPA